MMRRKFEFPWRSRGDIRHDVDEELRFHLESRQQDLTAGGLSPDAARTKALAEFGDVDDARRYLRDIDGDIETRRRRRDYVSDLVHDVRYAVRSLGKARTFTLIAILTIAIGVGATTAIFSVVHGVLQQPLPFPDPEQLVKVWSANPSAGLLKASVSAVDLDDWRAQKQQIADIGGWWFADGASGVDLTGAGAPERVSTAFVSPGFFTTLRVPAMSGRLPREDEMVRGGDDRVVVLSYAYWQRHFGGAASAIGSTLTLGGEPYRVLGVMPRDFAFPSSRTEIFVPFSTIPDKAAPRIRPVRILEVVARLKPAATIAQGQAELNVITSRLAAQYPEDAAWGAATLMPLHEAVTGSVRSALIVLLAAVSFVLLMACVNVAGLLLARASTREREIAVRVSIGATSSRILRQLVTESLVLASFGGIAGSLLAVFGTRALLASSAGQLPRSDEVHVDATVLFFALGISLAAGLLFGMVPAIRAASTDLRGALNSGGRASTGAAHKLRNALVVVQVAFAVVLAVGAGLMVRSYDELLHVDSGFKPDHLLAVNFSINVDRHGDATWQQYYSDVIERVRTVPGVVSAGAAQYAPFRGMGERNGFVPVGFQTRPGEEPPTFPTQRISDGYFRTIGTPVLAGREFLPTDRRESPPVVVVNQAYAKRFFPGENAVGKLLTTGGKTPFTIIGVVGDIRQSAIAEEAQPLLYVSNLQNGRIKVTLVARTRDDPLAMTTSIRDAIWSLDRDQTITSIFTFDDIMKEAMARPRLVTVLFSGFATVGLLLGAIGIYGVLAFLVTQRRREIGLRIALGATSGGVMRMVLKRALILTLTGVVGGVVISVALSRFVASLLYGVTATDAVTYVGVALALAAAAALASWIPARRAVHVDPLVVLQQE